MNLTLNLSILEEIGSLCLERKKNIEKENLERVWLDASYRIVCWEPKVAFEKSHGKVWLLLLPLRFCYCIRCSEIEGTMAEIEEKNF